MGAGTMRRRALNLWVGIIMRTHLGRMLEIGAQLLTRMRDVLIMGCAGMRARDALARCDRPACVETVPKRRPRCDRAICFELERI